MAGIAQPEEMGNEYIDPKSLSIEEVDQDSNFFDSAKTPPTVINGFTAVNANRNIQRPRSPKRPISFDIWSDGIYNSQEDIFTNPGIPDSSAITAPFAPSTASASRGLKRKARALEETDGNIQAQTKPQTSQEPTRELNTLSMQESIPADIEAHTPSTAEGASTGWEDIDRTMIEEYGRFINFI